MLLLSRTYSKQALQQGEGSEKFGSDIATFGFAQVSNPRPKHADIVCL